MVDQNRADRAEEQFQPYVDRAVIVTRMQIAAARRLLGESDITQNSENLLALTEVIATNWAGLD